MSQSESYVYEGQVRLEVQDGGFATPSIELSERPDPDQPAGVLAAINKRGPQAGKSWPADLASELERHFRPAFDSEHGTVAPVGRCKIVVERLALPPTEGAA